MADAHGPDTTAVGASCPRASADRFRLGVAVIVLTGLVILVVVLCLPPIPQRQSYHDFADNRVVLGIGRFGDVATHIPYLIVGLLGLWWMLSRRGGRRPGAFTEPGQAVNYIAFFFGFTLTAFGSTWYHLDPSDETLFWDRLPMSLTFMALFSALVGERISARAARYLLPASLVVGVASVLYWRLGGPNGDLRFYFGLVQVYPMTAIVLMLVLFPPRYSHGVYFLWMFGAYGLAVICEALDRPVYDLTGGVASGHNLKHLLAATGVLCVLLMLRRRRPIGAAGSRIAASTLAGN